MTRISALGAGLENLVQCSIVRAWSWVLARHEASTRTITQGMAFETVEQVSSLPVFAVVLGDKRHMLFRRSRGRQAFHREPVPTEVQVRIAKRAEVLGLDAIQRNPTI